MIYNISSDYHLGTRRAAHTTRDSARRLQECLYTQALWATEPPNSLCLGDAFDRPYNDETTLVQGYIIASRCDLVLSGNHDETGRESATTSLRALEQLGSPVVAAPDLSTPFFYVHGPFWVVPHHASQALFEQALQAAMEDASASSDHSYKYLAVHTNYDCPFDTEDSTLNLSPEDVETLLEVFARVFSGHEHNPKELFGGRLVIVGNTMATSFSDISDKFRWELDTRTNELNKVLIWEKAYAYREIQYGDPIPDLAGVQFVDVVGAQPVENGVEVAEYVRSVWESGSKLLAVRNNVEILDHLADVSGVDTSKPALVDLKQRISDDLEGSDLQPLYQRLVAVAEDQA